jgi:hypothetical protein
MNFDIKNFAFFNVAFCSLFAVIFTLYNVYNIQPAYLSAIGMGLATAGALLTTVLAVLSSRPSGTRAILILSALLGAEIIVRFNVPAHIILLILAFATACIVISLAVSGRRLLRGVDAVRAKEAAPGVLLALVAGGFVIASGLMIARWFELI